MPTLCQAQFCVCGIQHLSVEDSCPLTFVFQWNKSYPKIGQGSIHASHRLSDNTMWHHRKYLGEFSVSQKLERRDRLDMPLFLETADIPLWSQDLLQTWSQILRWGHYPASLGLSIITTVLLRDVRGTIVGRQRDVRSSGREGDTGQMCCWL